ncbi:HAD family hydrolase [Novosphingobium album (ex Hu et al. 2023)]|uniref:HAD family hydrolase n=1 Tax=Novosphingobium album (ex Hu et al. 2023) TaxID=2930093 RepID=A0ABT0B0Q9_9SPHN|nr:HAD family hydrolase [Novosphingobium album (ex Hu et al. 2023)]MCJ2178657.1 HAD family hydrolase [Novosphingobium album (ex Hu et al. 2023)]
MKLPLLITDCDEVLLYMIAHFRDWLAEEEGVAFDMSGGNFFQSMRRVESGERISQEDMWALLNKFFDGQMHRQTPVEGAVEAIAAIREHADVVVLTNLLDFRREARREQLAGHGIDVRVFTNQGPKGPALQAILDEYRPDRAVFIDDLSQHHGSVFEIAPQVRRLHLCAEPAIAPHIPCAAEAGHAHARIDEWERALPWLLESLTCEEKDLQAK